jgi:3-isopropylmalate/(R)-2-methylmalate dehydratase small subunit
MNNNGHIEGIAASLPLANLDTDQIMPKQFLRGIDKSGLDKGVLYDMRFDGAGAIREDFVLNQPEYAQARVLIAGPNFGCGSSREHAVWGLQQYGIQAVIAPSFGEIFYSNAMNNRLLLIGLTEQQVQRVMADAADPATSMISIDVHTMTVRSHSCSATFTLLDRHRHMFIEGLDMIGASLVHKDAILAFASRHWAQQPWLKDVAGRSCERLFAGA